MLIRRSRNRMPAAAAAFGWGWDVGSRVLGDVGSRGGAPRGRNFRIHAERASLIIIPWFWDVKTSERIVKKDVKFEIFADSAVRVKYY